MAGADLLLHPVRLRIVQAFLGDRALTTGQLATELDDVPPASLYRHVARLATAGILQVVAERRIRAVTERTYTLRAAAAQIQPDEVAAMTPAEHYHAFVAYVAGLLAAAERYLTHPGIDPVRDGAGYRVGALWLTDGELADLARDLRAVIQPRLALGPGPRRRRRLVYNVVLPAPEEPGPAASDAGSGRRVRTRTGATARATPRPPA